MPFIPFKDALADERVRAGTHVVQEATDGPFARQWRIREGLQVRHGAKDWGITYQGEWASTLGAMVDPDTTTYILSWDDVVWCERSP